MWFLQGKAIANELRRRWLRSDITWKQRGVGNEPHYNRHAATIEMEPSGHVMMQQALAAPTP
jgi:hypothetical protein